MRACSGLQDLKSWKLNLLEPSGCSCRMSHLPHGHNSSVHFLTLFLVCTPLSVFALKRTLYQCDGFFSPSFSMRPSCALHRRDSAHNRRAKTVNRQGQRQSLNQRIHRLPLYVTLVNLLRLMPTVPNHHLGTASEIGLKKHKAGCVSSCEEAVA